MNGRVDWQAVVDDLVLKGSFEQVKSRERALFVAFGRVTGRRPTDHGRASDRPRTR